MFVFQLYIAPFVCNAVSYAQTDYLRITRFPTISQLCYDSILSETSNIPRFFEEWAEWSKLVSKGVSDSRYKEHTYSEWNIFYPPHDLNTKNYDDLFGMRLALFNYTTGETGGSADFDGVQFQHVNEIDR